jgi:hypothetical protein
LIALISLFNRDSVTHERHLVYGDELFRIERVPTKGDFLGYQNNRAFATALERLFRRLRIESRAHMAAAGRLKRRHGICILPFNYSPVGKPPSGCGSPSAAP